MLDVGLYMHSLIYCYTVSLYGRPNSGQPGEGVTFQPCTFRQR